MTPLRRCLLVICASIAPSIWCAPAPIFDGKTFDGWEGATGSVWRIADGAIVGGSLSGNPHNEFLATTRSYKNFALKLEYKLIGTEGFINGGVQFRSRRMEKPAYEMIGYQADIGAGYSGCLYDESRRKKTLVTANKELVTSAEKPGDWNTYEVRCEGPRIVIRLNGKTTVDYTEREPGIEETGLIALQIHGGAKSEISYRRITIDVLPDDLVPAQAEILQRFGDPTTSIAAASRAPFADGRFALQTNDVVILAGQGNFVREQSIGALESRLALAYADRQPRFRLMAVEGDTVYDQWRDVNFGSWTEQLAAAGATTVFLQYGQLEALEGAERGAAFRAAYSRLMDQFATHTPRLVVLSPLPFETPAALHAPDLSQRNQELRRYVEEARSVAREHGALFVDLFTPLQSRRGPRLTEDGFHLTAEGWNVVANLIARALAIPAIDPSRDTPALRAAIREKNRLFANAWRPANWSFAYGDRATQPYGKPSAGQPPLRGAFARFKPVIEQQDILVQSLAQGKTPPETAAWQLPTSTSDSTVEATAPTPEAELASFTVADGYEISLFASEKDGVVKPTQITWDERGRLIVACSPSYPQPIADRAPNDYILVLEDADRTGRAARSWKFAENLTLVQGVELGDGGVYACDFDQLVYFRDRDGDGRADERRVVLAGFGTGDTHQLVNSVSHGPDGSLWLSQGLHAFSRVETPWGITRLEKAGLWRFDPKSLRLDSFFNGGAAGYNCWGVVFDDYGQPFHKSGDRPEGYYSLPGLVRSQAAIDDYHPVGSLFTTTPKTTAIDLIGTRGLPDDIQGCAVIGGYFGGVVELHRLLDDGAGFVSEQLPKLVKSSSPSFRPVDVSVGPDGAIYVADWCNTVIGHYQASYADPMRDKTHGRIWRIAAKGRAPVRPPDLAAMSPAQWLEQLRSPERWVRAQAKRLLFDAKEQEVLASADAWLSKLDPAQPDAERLLIEVAGVYQAHHAARPELVKRLLAARDPRVRAYGTRVVGEWANQLPSSLALLQASVRDGSPRVRLEAVVATSWSDDPAAIEVATEALDSPHDRFIDYALAQTVRGGEDRWKPALQSGRLTFGSNATHLAYVREISGRGAPTISPGQAVYDGLCLNCHQPSGKGLAGVYPPLASNRRVAGDPATLIKILLHGLQGPINVSGQTFGREPAVPMPPSGLDDAQIAAVLTYVRTHFGNQASDITTSQVAAVRRQNQQRSSAWTDSDLTR